MLTSTFARLRNISFCRLRTCFRSPACVALKIRCRSRCTFSSWSAPFDRVPVEQVLRSVQRIAAHLERREIDHDGRRVLRHVAQLAHMVPAFRWLVIRQRVTRLTSAPLRAQALSPVCGQLYADDRMWRVRSRVFAFLLAFRLPPFASWPSCPAPDIRLPCGRPTGGRSSPPDLTGFPCSALVRRDRCRAPPIPRDRGAHMTGLRHTGHHYRLPAVGPVLRWSFHLPKFWITRLTEIHLYSPFRPSPCL